MRRSRGAAIWLFAACWLLIAGGAQAQERHLHTYSMRHALPEQVTPALNAQIGAGSSITPYQQQLILNVTDAEYRTLVALLEQLDVAQRSLLISVRNRGQNSTQDSRYGVEGNIGTGAVRVQTGHGGDARIEAGRSEVRGSDDGAQQVRAVEGMEAFISAGNLYPVRVDRHGGRELVPVATGFYATARVVGDEVVIDIDQRDDRLRGRTIQTQGVQTQVRGRLGTWIPLGALQSDSQRSERDIAAYGDRNAASTTDLAIKVDIAQ